MGWLFESNILFFHVKSYVGGPTAGSTTESLLEGNHSAGNSTGPWEGRFYEMLCLTQQFPQQPLKDNLCAVVRESRVIEREDSGGWESSGEGMGTLFA